MAQGAGMKIVINAANGGFGLSQEAYELLISEHKIPVFVERSWLEDDSAAPDIPAIIKGSDPDYYWSYWFVDHRDDPRLVAVVEQLGERANDRLAQLKVVEIPDDVEWELHEYAGNEHIAEKHRTWR